MSKTRIVVAALSLSAAAFIGLVSLEGYTERAIIPTKTMCPLSASDPPYTKTAAASAWATARIRLMR